MHVSTPPPAPRNEKIENIAINQTASRIQRLQDLVWGGGAWSNNDNINLIYWYPDTTAPGGGCWVAWEDPAPVALTAAGIIITP